MIDFLQSNTEYRELSKTIKGIAEHGTQPEKDALEFYFEKALRDRAQTKGDCPESLMHGVSPMNTPIKKSVLDNISASRHTEIQSTTNKFVNKLFDILETEMSAAMTKAEKMALEMFDKKIKAMEDHELDDLINAKISLKSQRLQKAFNSSLGLNRPLTTADLPSLIQQIDKAQKTRREN